VDRLVTWAVQACGWIDASVDNYVVNVGFDESCRGVSESGRLLSKLQNGQVQRYLQAIGIGLAVLAVILLWSRRG
jgi:hypothetical protein